MNRGSIDVRTEVRKLAERAEVRKLAESKPFHAAAGAGLVATTALREIPVRIARWRAETTLTSLPERATKYVTTARVVAVREYDKLAVRGERVLGGKPALNGKARTAARTPKKKS
ncbi:MAG TPA: hypothetical protein VG253_01090 [Streptosporangiaceae bacterium]|jgi:hypothetical protein|nr:hypothetical protein [Streptosporangiaceae bacterium]